MFENYYVARKSELLKDFDRLAKRVKRVFLPRFGDDLTNVMIEETRREYEALIPQLPFIGGKQPFTQFIIATAQFLAMYRVLKVHGRTVEETGKMIYELCEVLLSRFPGFLLPLIGRRDFSKKYRKALRERAAESQKREYAGDYVYTYVEGNAKEFDYGIDYTECGSVKFLKKQGALELAPYLCLIDILYSEKFGWGLKRTTTLAEGHEKCDFRFRKGGKTNVTSRLLQQHNT